MAKKQEYPLYISKDELKILARVSQDVFLFSDYCYVINPIKGKVKFKLYPYQRAVLYQFVKERFNIILKFRQAGITELISMYCLWLTMYHANKKVNIISIKDTTAKKVLKKIKFMYKNLPYFMRTPIINGRANEYGSASLIEFDNGSFIESIPTSPEAGRSEALTLLVIDEAAMVRWANEVYAAALPTLSCSVGSTKLFTREYIQVKKNCIKPITKQVKLRNLCPNEKGILDISNLNLYTLTHTGQWRKVLKSQNKGKLETWFVKDKLGKKGGYTPAHRLFTTKGWKTVAEIIEQNLNVIQIDTKVDTLTKPPVTTPPKEEILKPLREFPWYKVSNLGKVYDENMKEVPQRPSKDGYMRVALKDPHIKRDSGSEINCRKSKTFQRSVHLLVAEAFIGPKLPKYQVDHINCNRSDNHVNNLRYTLSSDNISRSFKHNLAACLTPISNDKLPDLLKRGRILEMAEEGYIPSKIAKEVYPEAKQGAKFVKRILKERGSRVYISKLQVVKKTQRTIFDIEVEGDHSYISATNYVNHNTGGSAIINSTPRGIGGFYHSQWVDAISGVNGLNPIRLYWDMHPERDQAWYDQMSKALGPKRTAQEIDGDFLSSGNTVFDLVDIKAIEDCLSDYPTIKTRFNGQFRQFLEPVDDEQYYIGADVATGRSNDYSSFTLMNRTGEEYAIYKGRMAVDKYARLLGDTGQLFNNAKIAPESNDVGLAVTSLLQTEGYPNLYYYQKLLRKKGKSKPDIDLVPGWMTTNNNRAVIVENLEKDIREDNIIVKDPFFVQEAYTFIYDTMGRPVALNKHKANTDGDLDDDVYSDDDIFGKAICNHIRKQRDNISTLPI